MDEWLALNSAFSGFSYILHPVLLRSVNKVETWADEGSGGIVKGATWKATRKTTKLISGVADVRGEISTRTSRIIRRIVRHSALSSGVSTASHRLYYVAILQTAFQTFPSDTELHFIVPVKRYFRSRRLSFWRSVGTLIGGRGEGG